MKFNMLKKLLKNKHILIIGIICLITLTCISLASAADVNTNESEITNEHIDNELEHNILDNYGEAMKNYEYEPYDTYDPYLNLRLHPYVPDLHDPVFHCKGKIDFITLSPHIIKPSEPDPLI